MGLAFSCWAWLRTMGARLFLLLVVLGVAVWAQAPADSSNAFVWQGYRHAWQRTTLSFKTPHRLGSFSNYIHDETFNDDSAKAQSTVTFTPGVNGDFAFPETYYGLVRSSGAVETSRFDVNFSLQDNATATDPDAQPEARMNEVVQWSTPALSTSAQWAVLLRGYKIDMHCDPDKQPAGGECNSNGVWPFYLEVALEQCQLTEGRISCGVRFHLDRGNIPFHFRFSKPFNFVMNYNVTVGITVLQSTASSAFHATYAPDISVSQLRAFPASPVRGNTYLQGVGNSAYSSAITGIRGLSLQLNETLDVESLGRYLESIEANVEDLFYDPVSGKQQLAYSVGISTVVTVVPVTYSAAVSPVLLQFDSHTAAYSTAVNNGTICFSDQAFPFTFQCRLKGMRPTTTDEVSLAFPDN